jgi:hypothetical protein
LAADATTIIIIIIIIIIIHNSMANTWVLEVSTTVVATTVNVEVIIQVDGLK